MFRVYFRALLVELNSDKDGALLANNDIIGDKRIVLSSPNREVLAPSYYTRLPKGFSIEKGNKDLVLSCWRCHCRIELGGFLFLIDLKVFGGILKDCRR